MMFNPTKIKSSIFIGTERLNSTSQKVFSKRINCEMLPEMGDLVFLNFRNEHATAEYLVA